MTLNEIMMATRLIGRFSEEVNAERSWNCHTLLVSLSAKANVILTRVVVGVKSKSNFLLSILAMFTMYMHRMQVFSSELSGMSCGCVNWNMQDYWEWTGGGRTAGSLVKTGNDKGKGARKKRF